MVLQGPQKYYCLSCFRNVGCIAGLEHNGVWLVSFALFGVTVGGTDALLRCSIRVIVSILHAEAAVQVEDLTVVGGEMQIGAYLFECYIRTLILSRYTSPSRDLPQSPNHFLFHLTLLSDSHLLKMFWAAFRCRSFILIESPSTRR